MSGKTARAARQLAGPAPRLVLPFDTTPPPADEVRHAHRFARYPGDVAAEILADPVMGPNERGKHMVAVFAHHDPVDNVTRAGFTFATVHDLMAAAERELNVAGARP